MDITCPSQYATLLLLLLLVLQKAVQAQVGETKLFSCFRNPTSTVSTVKYRSRQAHQCVVHIK